MTTNPTITPVSYTHLDVYKRQRVGIYSFDATLVSYTDLTGFSADDVTYDKEQQRLTLYISPIQVELRGRDFTLRTEYEYVAPLRNAITPQEMCIRDRCYDGRDAHSVGCQDRQPRADCTQLYR